MIFRIRIDSGQLTEHKSGKPADAVELHVACIDIHVDWPAHTPKDGAIHPLQAEGRYERGHATTQMPCMPDAG